MSETVEETPCTRWDGRDLPTGVIRPREYSGTLTTDLVSQLGREGPCLSTQLALICSLEIGYLFHKCFTLVSNLTFVFLRLCRIIPTLSPPIWTSQRRRRPPCDRETNLRSRRIKGNLCGTDPYFGPSPFTHSFIFLSVTSSPNPLPPVPTVGMLPPRPQFNPEETLRPKDRENRGLTDPAL